jgi:hypothetical protein
LMLNIRTQDERDREFEHWNDRSVLERGSKTLIEVIEMHGGLVWFLYIAYHLRSVVLLKMKYKNIDVLHLCAAEDIYINWLPTLIGQFCPSNNIIEEC